MQRQVTVCEISFVVYTKYLRKKMPLIMVTGIPSSGKSRRANELRDYFEQKCERKVHIVSENEIILNRPGFEDVFLVPAKEKQLRGAIKSEVQRLLNKDDVIIADAGNYIKGYRYELYCLGKTARSTQCVVHCEVSEATAWQWNEASGETERRQRYTRPEFDALLMRYEGPEGRNRWDAPLYIVHGDEPLDLTAIADSLLHSKPAPPNQSTQAPHSLPSNVLYDMDQITKDIVERIASCQGDGEVELPGGVTIPVTSTLTRPQLGRIRAQFLQFAKGHPPRSSNPQEAAQATAQMFASFLRSRLEAM